MKYKYNFKKGDVVKCVDAVRKGYTISKVFDKDYMKEYYL